MENHIREMLAPVAERIEQSAWEEIYEAADPAFAKTTGLRSQRMGSATLLLAERMPVIMFNRVIAFGMSDAVDAATVAGVAERYRDAGIAKFAVQPGPNGLTDDVLDALSAHGLQRLDNWVKMARDAAPPPAVECELSIEQIGPGRAHEFGMTVCAGFGMPEMMAPLAAGIVGHPGWRHYMAFDGTTPIATGALYVRDGVGWLGIGSTRPEHRRRGAQGALMARRIADAIDLGCRWITTETGEETADRPNPSYRNMVRMGFALVHVRPNFIAMPTDTTNAG